MVSPPNPLNHALASSVRDRGASPILTWYSNDGDRVELSVVTFANAVAKTAGLLRDELRVEAGDRVHVALPRHWQASVWMGACSAVGARLTLAVAGQAADEPVRVAVHDDPDTGLESTADEIVITSAHPLGMPGPPLESGLVDHARAAMAQPDHFEPFPSADRFSLTDSSGTQLDSCGVADLAHEMAGEWGMWDPDRHIGSLLSFDPPWSRAGWLGTWAVPVIMGTTSVSVASDSAAVRRAERVTWSTAGTPRPEPD